MSPTRIKKPTSDEIARFSSLPTEKDKVAAYWTILWGQLSKPDLKFYIALEEKPNEKLSVHMEVASDRPWLRGIIFAFLSKQELKKYIQALADIHNYGDTSGYRTWTATLQQVHKTVSGIIKSGRGVRVELHKVTVDEEIELVDILWDNFTT